MFSRLAPARRRFFWSVIAIASVAVLAIVVRVLVSGEPEVAPVSQSDRGPVLLVPGYGGDTSSLEVLADALESSDREVRIVEPRDGGTGDLVAQARRVRDVAQGLIDDGAPSVDVVGYSAGGVVVRLFVDELGGGSMVRRAITLAAPHHGTELAGLAGDLAQDACPTACQQLAPDSDLLRDLNAGDETPPGPQWVALWTTDDLTVVPPTSGTLDGAVDFSVQSVCADLEVQHGEVPSTEAVINIVRDELDRRRVGTPDRDVCG